MNLMILQETKLLFSDNLTRNALQVSGNDFSDYFINHITTRYGMEIMEGFNFLDPSNKSDECRI